MTIRSNDKDAFCGSLKSFFAFDACVRKPNRILEPAIPNIKGAAVVQCKRRIINRSSFWRCPSVKTLYIHTHMHTNLFMIRPVGCNFWMQDFSDPVDLGVISTKMSHPKSCSVNRRSLFLSNVKWIDFSIRSHGTRTGWFSIRRCFSMWSLKWVDSCVGIPCTNLTQQTPT